MASVEYGGLGERQRGLTALVVDDDITARAFLRALLRKAGYQVDIAVSGEDALARFKPGIYGVVFMDVRMPGIDGIETTRRLKAMSGTDFTPVIFVTGEGDDESLVRAIDSGGDDFLVKPVTAMVLLAKLRAMERIRSLHAETQRLYERVIEDQLLAREVFDRAVAVQTIRTPALQARMMAAEVFGGDVVLTAVAPSQRFHVLVGDFTGHGLAAALGAMPLAEVFRAAVDAGLEPDSILGEINRRICQALPGGHFLAASLVCVDPALARLVVANCGMPALVLFGPAGVRERLRSTSIPLGILPRQAFGSAIRQVSLEPGDRVLIATDGVTEALNADGEVFGEARLQATLATIGHSARSSADAVGAALDAFRGHTPLRDDAGLVEVRLSTELWH